MKNTNKIILFILVIAALFLSFKIHKMVIKEAVKEAVNEMLTDNLKDIFKGNKNNKDPLPEQIKALEDFKRTDILNREDGN